VKQKSKYKIVASIGSQSLSQIFSAFDVSNGELVALKKIDNARLSDRDFVSKLNFIVSLDHPNIVACKNLEYAGNIGYLVMDYGEGGSLRQLISTTDNWSLDRTLRLITDILSGLEYAHNRGVIHGNLKPENILLKLSNNHWQAQIADFYPLNFKVPKDLLPTEKSVYQAPEQLKGCSSCSSDLYGVGVILFELLTGKPPVWQDSGMKLLEEESIPLVLHSTLVKALQLQPDKRFLNAGKMLESIQLARAILNKTQPNSTLQPLSSDRSIRSLTIIGKEELLHLVTNIVINSQQVYLETNNSLCGRLYLNTTLTGEPSKEWQIFLDGYLETLEIRPQGYFARTKSASIYYLPEQITTEQFNFFSTTYLPIISLPAKKSLAAIDPQGTWLALAYLPNKVPDISWEILQLPSLKVVGRLTTEFLPNWMIALNRRHGLAIFAQKQQGRHTTILQWFNRRGHWLGNYSLSVALRWIVYNPLFSDRLFAIEGGNNNPTMGSIVHLKPFQVNRIPLPFAPSFVIPHSRGYLLCDRQGKMAIINGKDNSLTQFQIPLEQPEKITAIAAKARSQLLVATWSKSGGNLWQFSLDNI
jgi:serine/threonine protein kinase